MEIDGGNCFNHRIFAVIITVIAVFLCSFFNFFIVKSSFTGLFTAITVIKGYLYYHDTFFNI
jgi:hypothetical protein